MLAKRVCWILFFFGLVGYAQKGELIFENDSIALYESLVSKDSYENLYPTPYKEGILYTSAFKNDYYRLLYSNGKDKPEKVRISKRFQLGPVSLFENEIYFTGMSNFMNAKGEPHLSIFKGTLQDFKVSKVKELDLCIDGYTYAHASISEDGQTLILVSNENDVYHIMEYKRNEQNKWERGEPVFITQLNFKILNPVFHGPDTIYFSSNIFDGKLGNLSYEQVDDKIVLVGVDRYNVSFNIFKVERLKNGDWSIPEKVKALSSEYDDLGVQFTGSNSGYISTYRYDNTNNIFFFELKQ